MGCYFDFHGSAWYYTSHLVSQAEISTRLKTLSFFFLGKGRSGGDIDYQDTPRVRPCSLFLDVLSRKVLVVNIPTPAST